MFQRFKTGIEHFKRVVKAIQWKIPQNPHRMPLNKVQLLHQTLLYWGMTVMLSLSLVITINGHSNDHLITPCATRGVNCRATPQQRDALSCNCNGKLLLVRPMQATQTEQTTGVRSLTASRDCDHQLLSGAEGGGLRDTWLNLQQNVECVVLYIHWL